MTTFRILHSTALAVTALWIVLAGSKAGAAVAPASAQALFDAQGLAAEGRVEAALERLDGALDGDPRATPLLNELALAHARSGRLEAARDTLERALATAPVYAQLYENLLAVKQAIALQGYRQALTLPEDGAPTLGLASIPAGAEPLAVAEEPEEAEAVAEPGRTEDPQQTEQAAPEPADPGPPDDFVRDWADAWQRQDVSAYLDAYVPGYVGAPAADHAAWRALREVRVGGPAFIELELGPLDVRRTGPEAAVVEFDQRYRSDTFADDTRKLLVLRAGPEGWRIEREYEVR